MLKLVDDNFNAATVVEQDILALREIEYQIKVLKARYDAIKASLLTGYFSDSDEFVGSDGLLMATYKCHVENRFDSKAFKSEHPTMYKRYQRASEVRKFLLKK